MWSNGRSRRRASLLNIKQSCFTPRSSNTDTYFLVYSTKCLFLFKKRQTHTHTHTHIHLADPITHLRSLDFIIKSVTMFNKESDFWLSSSLGIQAWTETEVKLLSPGSFKTQSIPLNLLLCKLFSPALSRPYSSKKYPSGQASGPNWAIGWSGGTPMRPPDQGAPWGLIYQYFFLRWILVSFTYLTQKFNGEVYLFNYLTAKFLVNYLI
jgi:hypothetical protein